MATTLRAVVVVVAVLVEMAGSNGRRVAVAEVVKAAPSIVVVTVLVPIAMQEQSVGSRIAVPDGLRTTVSDELRTVVSDGLRTMVLPPLYGSPSTK